MFGFSGAITPEKPNIYLTGLHPVAARRTAGRPAASRWPRPGIQPRSAHAARRKVKLFPDGRGRGQSPAVDGGETVPYAASGRSPLARDQLLLLPRAQA